MKNEGRLERRSGPSHELYDRPSGEDKGTILLSSATIPGSSLRQAPSVDERCNNIFSCLDRTIGPLIYVVLHLTVPPLCLNCQPRSARGNARQRKHCGFVRDVSASTRSVSMLIGLYDLYDPATKDSSIFD